MSVFADYNVEVYPNVAPVNIQSQVNMVENSLQLWLLDIHLFE